MRWTSLLQVVVRPKVLRALLKTVSVGVTLGIVMAVIKGDSAGFRATIGNLVGPWLISALVADHIVQSRALALLFGFISTCSSVVVFYVVQGVLWGVYGTSMINYYLFWALKGPAACAVIQLARRLLSPGPCTTVIYWCSLSSIFAAAYWFYLYHIDALSIRASWAIFAAVASWLIVAAVALGRVSHNRAAPGPPHT